MHDLEWERPLGDILRLAGDRRLPDGWLYLPDGPVTGTTIVLFLDDRAAPPMADDAEEAPLDALARERGYPNEGLDTHDLGEVARWTGKVAADPTDDQLAAMFDYYRRYDTFPDTIPDTIDAEPPL